MNYRNNYARRIRARAIRRAGELLKQLEPAPNQHVAGMGAHTSRSEAAREAGMSKHQQVQAVRVASVPDVEFEEQVEAERPASPGQTGQGQFSKVSAVTCDTP